LSDNNYGVILCIFVSICPVTDISVTTTPIDVKVCKMVGLSSGHIVSHFGGDIFRGYHNARPENGEGLGFETSKKIFGRVYLKNGKSVRYMSIRRY